MTQTEFSDMLSTSNDLELLNLWRYISANFLIDKIEPLQYQGIFAGSEFQFYDAKKIYLAIKIEGQPQTAAQTAAIACRMDMYNEANGLFGSIGNMSVYYDTGAVVLRYIALYMEKEKLWFSRLSTAIGYVHIKYSGFKITLK
jgi:hypothetical protein